LGRIEPADLRPKADLRQLLDSDLARLSAAHLPALDEAEGDILPNGERIEQCRALEQHAEARQIGVTLGAFEMGNFLPRYFDRTGIGTKNAENGLDHHRLAGTRAADDHERLAFWHRDIDAVEDRLAAESLPDIREDDIAFILHSFSPRTGER